MFCGKKPNRIKALYWDNNGFVILYKRLEEGRFQWPRTDNEVRDLTMQQLRWLMETLKLNNRKMFGSLSEKTEDESAQLSIFNEAEEIADIRKPEPELEEVKSHYRKKRTKKDRLPEDLPVEVIEYRLNEEELDCPKCGEKLHEMGKEVVNISDMSPEEKYIKRQELSKPVLDDFFAWLNSFTPASQSHLGKAVAYTLNQWKNLQNYLLDGRLNICNNRAEYLAKSFALCRKNFLFSNTPRGAEASATVMSIIETAKANKIDSFKYLTYIL